jgi:hypothetical protein
MPCEEWSWILYQYRSAVRIYSDAAAALGVAASAGFRKNWELSEEARQACGRFRADLLEHEHRHGCQMIKGEQKARRAALCPPLTQKLRPLTA